MPSSMHMIDAGLPQFTGTERTEDKVAAIQNYLFMLLEELRYVLQNLGTENFNSAELDGLKTEIRNAVKIDLSGDGDMATIQVDLAGLHTSIRNAEGSISTLEQTAEELRTEVSGKIDGSQAQTMITQNLNSITLSAEAGTNKSTITISAGGVAVDSVEAKFNHITADEIVAHASIQSPIIKSGDGHYQLTTDDTIGNQAFLINYVDSFISTPLLRIYYDALGRLSLASLYEGLATYNANGNFHTLELLPQMVRITNRISVGANSFGYRDPIDAQIPGENGMLYFQIVS